MFRFLKQMRIRTKLLLLTAIFVAMVGGLGGMFWFAFTAVKVNGPIYREIVRGKDLVADILPPPEYIIETYLNVQLLLNEKSAESQLRAIDKFKTLRSDFDARL